MDRTNRFALCLFLVVSSAPAVLVAGVGDGLFGGEPRGPYPTGTLEIEWVDDRREELQTLDPDDKRHLMVQIWYPAALKGDPQRARYILSPEHYLVEPRPTIEGARQMAWADALRRVRTDSIVGAPLAESGQRFPVLIYNHGGGYPGFTATFQAEFFASHGYVVVAIDRPGENGASLQRFPSGYVFRHRILTSGDADPAANPFGLAKEQEARMSLREQYESGWKDRSIFEMESAMDDMRFVLDQLEAADADRRNRFYQRLDLERVGALGWSLGGALSLKASREDTRIRAAINQDGWPWGLADGNGVAVKGSPRPVMIMTGEPQFWVHEDEIDAGDREVVEAADLQYWTMLQRSVGEWYWLRLSHARHGHFSDLSLFDAEWDPGSIHPRLAHTIIKRHALEFFDKHLRGREDTPLLSGKSRYRDARLQRRKKDKDTE